MSNASKTFKYGIIRINLEVRLPEQEKAGDTPNGREWLETNLNSQISAVVKYARSQITLGNNEAVVGEAKWEWA